MFDHPDDEWRLDTLDEKDKTIVRGVFERWKYTNEEYFYFWTYDDLQLDGNFSLEDLKTFVKAMELMEERRK